MSRRRAAGCAPRYPRGSTLAIEADDVAAAAEHAAFAGRCRPLPLHAVGGDAEEAAWLRAELIGQLDAMRRSAAASGLGYLGALAGDQGGRPVLILLGIATTPFVFPAGNEASNSITVPDGGILSAELGKGKGD